MQSVHEPVTKEMVEEDKAISSNHFIEPSPLLPKWYQQQKRIIQNFSQRGKLPKKFRVVKRLSPFLLVALSLPLLLIYSLVKENAGVLEFSLFIFLEINILFIDFALWNYYEGKKYFVFGL